MIPSCDPYYVLKLYGTFQNGLPQNASHRTLGPLNIHEEIKIPYLSKFGMLHCISPLLEIHNVY